MFEFYNLRALALENVAMLLEIKNNTSMLHQLLKEEGGYITLQRLLLDPSISKKITEHPYFLGAFLIVLERKTSILYLLSKTDIGHEILQQLLSDEVFKAKLFKCRAFVPTLLKEFKNEKNKDTSALFWLLSTEGGRRVLQSVFANECFIASVFRMGEDRKRHLLQLLRENEHFKTLLLQSPALIPGLCKIMEDLGEVEPILFLSLWDESGHRIFQSLLENEPFRTKMLQETTFIQALLVVPVGKNASLLFFLACTQGGIKTLQQLFSDPYATTKLLQDPAFIPVLLKTIESPLNDHSSVLSLLSHTEYGCQLLQKLLLNELFKTRLLLDPTFIKTLFRKIQDSIYGNITLLFWFARSESGVQILQQLFTEEPFKVQLLKMGEECHILQSLIGNYSVTIKLLRLENVLLEILGQVFADERLRTRFLQTESECQVLQHLLSDISFQKQLFQMISGHEILLRLMIDESFKKRLIESESKSHLIQALGNAHIIEKLLQSEIGHQILLQLFANEYFRERFLQVENQCQILQQLFANETFRSKLLQENSLIQILLKPIETGIRKNTSILYWFTIQIREQLILKEMLHHPVFRDRFSQHKELIHALFLQTPQGGTVFLNLLNTFDGLRVIQILMASPHFRANYRQYFQIDVPDEQISWTYQSIAGVSLFKLLLEEKQQHLLRIPFQELLAHPQIQLYVRQGVIDPSLFLLISAVEIGAAFLHYLQHPQCSPWVMTDKGHSLRDLIEASPLEEVQKRDRVLALDSMIRTRQEETSRHGLVIHPHLMGRVIEPPIKLTAPEMPPTMDVPFHIEGVDDVLIQAFQQRLTWLCSQPHFIAYHVLFKGLFDNPLMRNSQDFPITASHFTELCLWMNGYLQANINLPEPEPDWQYDLQFLCQERIQNTFKQIFTLLSKQPEIAFYLQHVTNTISADYCRLLAIPANMEVHLPKAAIAAEMGLASSLPIQDVYLRNLNKRQKQWIAQSAMDVLIHQEPLIRFLVDRLCFDVQEITFQELMKKYFYYRYSSIFDTEITETEFMVFVTGLSKEALAERDFSSETIPIRPDLNALLNEKASAYVNHLPFYSTDFQEKNEVLWQFLTANPEQFTLTQRSFAEDLLSQCAQAVDGVALIKHCMESHQDNIDDFNLNVLFYQNAQGISLFSLLLASPLLTEWFFDYQTTVTSNRNNELSIAFAQKNTFMSQLKLTSCNFEAKTMALNSAISQPGTLFFWLYYFQRTALFAVIFSFIMDSPKVLYTYDRLSSVIFDMLRSRKVSEDHKNLVQAFLELTFNEQIVGHNEHCWLTISLSPAPQEIIVTTLRSNPWALSTLSNPEHLNTIHCLMQDRKELWQEIRALLQTELQAPGRFSLFNLPPNEDLEGSDFQLAKRSRL